MDRFVRLDLFDRRQSDLLLQQHQLDLFDRRRLDRYDPLVRSGRLLLDLLCLLDLLLRKHLLGRLGLLYQLGPWCLFDQLNPWRP